MVEQRQTVTCTKVDDREGAVDAGSQQTCPQEQHQLAADGGEAFHHLPLEGRPASLAWHEEQRQQGGHQRDHRQNAEPGPEPVDQQHQQRQGHRQPQGLQPQGIAFEVRHPEPLHLPGRQSHGQQGGKDAKRQYAGQLQAGGVSERHRHGDEEGRPEGRSAEDPAQHHDLAPLKGTIALQPITDDEEHREVDDGTEQIEAGHGAPQPLATGPGGGACQQTRGGEVEGADGGKHGEHVDVGQQPVPGAKAGTAPPGEDQQQQCRPIERQCLTTGGAHQPGPGEQGGGPGRDGGRPGGESQIEVQQVEQPHPQDQIA